MSAGRLRQRSRESFRPRVLVLSRRTERVLLRLNNCSDQSGLEVDYPLAGLSQALERQVNERVIRSDSR